MQGARFLLAAPEQASDRQPLGGAGRRAGLQARQRQQPLDDTLHALGLLRHEGEVARLLVGVELERLQGLHEARQHRERRADLVRHVGDEVAPHGFGLLDRRDVAREHQLLALAVGAQLDGQARQAGAIAQARGDDDIVRPVLRCQVSGEVRVAQQVADELQHVALRVDGEVARRIVVAPDDAVAVVEQQHAVGRGLQRIQDVLQAHGAVLRRLLARAQQALHALGHFAQHPRARGRRAGGLAPQPVQHARRAQEVGDEPQPDARRAGPQHAPHAAPPPAQARAERLHRAEDQRADQHAGRPRSTGQRK